MNVSNLEPNVFLGKGPRRRVDNIFKTLKISSVKYTVIVVESDDGDLRPNSD
jgi:hypothetical protein